MESMEALALLDIDQEDDNLLIAWNDNPGNENAAAEEPSLLLGIMSPPSPSLVNHKPEKRQVFGDSQNCPVDHDLPALTWAIPVDTTGEVEDPGNIAMSKNPVEMLAASDLISVLSVLDSNVISSSNMTYDALEDGASRKAQYLMHDGILRMASVSKGPPMDNAYIDKARQQRQEIGLPEKVEDEPIVLRRNRTRRLTTLRKSLAWDKAFFTDDDKVSSTLPKAKLQVEISSTHAPSSSLSRAVKQVQRTSLHSIPTALPWSQKQAPGIKSNPLTALSNAAGKTQRFRSAVVPSQP
ncbi:unnamed protein product [Sphagnum jensenii]|uniref:Uncharacterized protein n=1 Tax=Sphagnum jensenii TaxID=128206 RepID=A0ABP1ACC6_9BRYO